MTARKSLLILVPFLLLARLARAEEGAARREQIRAARKACLSGDYTQGVAILSELFVDTEDPTFVYNQGRCFQQNQHYSEAISRFQEYLRIGKQLTTPARSEAEQQIAECERLLAKQSGQAAPAATQATSTSTAPGLPLAHEAASSDIAAQSGPTRPPVLQETNQPPEGAPGSYLRVASVVTAAVGVAALITGLALNLKANSMASDFGKLDGYTDTKASQRQTWETLSWAGYGVGGAGLAAATILYYLGSRSGAASATSLAILPAFAPGQASATVKGSF
ncbi:MAG: hypothetical protein ABSB49_19440 [Polyangia bacterium]|jgi:hypothetical protein